MPLRLGDLRVGSGSGSGTAKPRQQVAASPAPEWAQSQRLCAASQGPQAPTAAASQQGSHSTPSMGKSRESS